MPSFGLEPEVAARKAGEEVGPALRAASPPPPTTGAGASADVASVAAGA
jgi:hypothetical protein